ncbi:aKG-HExxH-type peptide beta-hydroxylase [Nonomuraea aurantiaca]|uniref:aKG-HExxH-type peptide beta-hydroxylase n=1 Tax=Nonomuraea aurantiaca TaxID=2878562 RepID=UPI0035577E51
MISVVTPLSGERWAASGTSRTAMGCVALARPRCARSLAASLAHEVQHAKLSVLFYLLDLVLATENDRFYAPWRHDHRPLTGLLHGTYAHLGVADFWQRQRYVDGTAAAAQIQRPLLAHGRRRRGSHRVLLDLGLRHALGRRGQRRSVGERFVVFGVCLGGLVGRGERRRISGLRYRGNLGGLPGGRVGCRRLAGPGWHGRLQSQRNVSEPAVQIGRGR